ATLKQLMENGMDVARLNFSHGNYEEHKQRIADIRKAAHEMNKTVSILLDTQGPEIRTHTFKEGQAQLNRGETVTISMNEVEGTAERFSLTYEGLMDDVDVGTIISLDDGLIELKVQKIDEEKKEIETKVLNGGTIKNKKGVNVPNVRVNLPSLTDKDIQDITFGIEQGVDFIAASFVRDHSDVLIIKQLLEEHRAEHIQIISKIENREGVNDFD